MALFLCREVSFDQLLIVVLCFVLYLIRLSLIIIMMSLLTCETFKVMGLRTQSGPDRVDRH